MSTPKRRKAVAKRAVRPRKAKPRRASAQATRASAIEIALAGLAHDIRTPLTGILSLAELLAASGLAERERQWAETIRSTAAHLAQLTTLVVDAAKADAGGLVLRREPFSPRDLVQAVAASLRARAGGKGLDVAVSMARTLPAGAVGDAVRLRSALENLIDNAVKFTERGRVTLRVSAEPAPRGRTQLVFAVSDSGIGITAADLKRLFRPFAQASEAVARRYGGAGLGLASVKRVARAMGGSLTVTSRPGEGSTFRLAVTVEPPSRAAAKAPRTKPAAVRALHVLCVEDNPYGRAVLSAVLGELGHRVSFAGSGEAAVDAVRVGRYDAVLMDITLPDIDGFEATQRIRRLPPPCGRVPIVGLSGRTGDDDATAAKKAGMDAYLRKPASPAELDEVLETVAARRGVEIR